jgi:hypothetical protein
MRKHPERLTPMLRLRFLLKTIVWKSFFSFRHLFSINDSDKISFNAPASTCIVYNTRINPYGKQYQKSYQHAQD